MSRRVFSLLALLVFSVSLAFARRPDVPAALSARLEDVIEEEQVSLILSDEEGVREENNLTTLLFAIPPDPGEWEISRYVGFAYSANLLADREEIISFSVAPLRHESGSVIDAFLTLESTNPDVTIRADDSLRVRCHSGYSGEVILGSLTVTARKPETRKLASGGYVGSVFVTVTSVE